MRISRNQWPVEWGNTELGQICSVVIGKTPPRGQAEYWGGENTWISISDMVDRVVQDSKEKISDLAVQSGHGKLIPSGTLLMSFKLTIGKLGFTGKDLFTNEAIAALIVRDEYKDRLIPDFLYWALKIVPLDAESILAVKGKTINKGKIERISIPFPSKIIQASIVNRIESLLFELSEARRLHNMIVADTNRLMDAVLAEVYPDAVEKLPDGWNLLSMTDICSINPTRPRNIPYSDETKASFVPMAAVDDREGKITDLVSRPFSEIKRGYTYFEENDVLFAKITPCMENGKAAIARELINGFGFGSTEFHVLRSHYGILPEWVYYFIRREMFRQEAKTKFRGAVGQKRVPQDFLETHLIPVPFPENPEKSLRIQKQIVSRVQTTAGVVAEAQHGNTKTGALLSQMEQAILAQAFRGEL